MDWLLQNRPPEPERPALCHGDFHPFNVMLSPRGPIVIDWNNAHIGNPLEDVALLSAPEESVRTVVQGGQVVVDRAGVSSR